MPEDSVKQEDVSTLGDTESRGQKNFGILLVILITGAVLYGLYANFLNFGTLQITADAPFNVQIFDGKTYGCKTSPCKIKQKTGMYDLIISKEGFETVVTAGKVSLWRTTELNIDFPIKPFIEAAAQFPTPSSQPILSLKQTQNGMYALLNENDPENIPLIYFPKKIQDPEIFVTDPYVLIIDTKTADAYRVNLIQKTKDLLEIPDANKITSAAISPDGKKVLYVKEDSANYWLANNKRNTELSLDHEYAIATFTDKNTVIFATKQEISSSGEIGDYGINYITIRPTISENTIFGFYHIDENSYTSLLTQKIPGEIFTLLPASNSQIIYFRTAESENARAFEDFQLILEKF